MQKKKQVTKTKYRNTKNWFKVLLPAEEYLLADGNKIERPSICQTVNFEVPRVYTWNRHISNAHPETIMDSVLTTRKILSLPIIVKMKDGYYILDGQNRTQMFKRLNDPHSPRVPMTFFLFEDNDMAKVMRTCALLNNSSKRWTLKQYVSTMALTNDDYAFLLSEHKRTGIQLRVLATLHAKRKEGTNIIKRGEHVRKEPKSRASLKADHIRFFLSHTPLVNTSVLNEALLEMITNYTLDYYRAIEKGFIKNVNTLVKKRKLENATFGTREEYVKFFQECWL